MLRIPNRSQSKVMPQGSPRMARGVIAAGLFILLTRLPQTMRADISRLDLRRVWLGFALLLAQRQEAG